MSETKPRWKMIVAFGLFGILIVGAVILFFLFRPPGISGTPDPASYDEPSDQVKTTALTIPIKPQSVLNYNKLGEDTELDMLIDQRKKDHGISSGVDLIAEPGESIRVGRHIVSINDILEQIKLENEELIESDLGEKSDSSPDMYGIYVVRKGDNIWNIHFKFLQDYLNFRNIHMGPIADEPNEKGFSSGVGKLLKFSEKMVYIYNIRDRKLDVNLDLIMPNSKLVVYHMKEVFSLLDQIDYDVVNRIEFDGENIWIPAEQNE